MKTLGEALRRLHRSPASAAVRASESASSRGSGPASGPASESAAGLAVEIGRPRHERTADGVRVVADVDGEPLWIEVLDSDLDLSEPSTGLPRLRAVPESFASMALLPGLAVGRPVHSAEPLDPVWRNNVRGLMTTAAQWWQLPVLEPHGPPAGRIPYLLTGIGRRIRPARARTALFFSAGADSFHALRMQAHRLDALVFLEGFDIALDDRPRLAATLALIREVAAESGLDLIRIRTNARRHPLIAAPYWGMVHGGVMAGVAHALGGTFLVSASYPLMHDRPWGTHWRLDPGWTGARARLEHTGAELWRSDKLRALADDPLVQRHLRVCWEHRTEGLNCSRCEKCLRTMLALAPTGQLERFVSFDTAAPLDALLDELPSVAPHLTVVFHNATGRGLPPAVDAALQRLVVRSGGLPDPVALDLEPA